ncbi:hypothetical protein ACF0H5_008800 [Mactra antiquata]
MIIFSFLFVTFMCHEVIFAFDESISIKTSALHAEVSEKFVGVAIDTGVVRRHWEKFHPNSQKVITLARGLSPCNLRVGGTDADFLTFKDDGSDCKGGSYKRFKQYFKTDHPNTVITEKKIDHFIEFFDDNDNAADNDDETLRFKPDKTVYDEENVIKLQRDVGYNVNEHHVNFTMTATFYDQLHHFVSNVGWELIFDLNSLLRVGANAWNSTNAHQLINYTATCGYKMAGWELGNEPDEYNNTDIKRQIIPTEQLSKDFQHMKDIVRQYALFDNCSILGPSIAAMSIQPRTEYYYSFLKSGGGNIVTAATFHQYYLNGRVATEEQFYDPDVLNILYDEIQTGVNLTRAAGSPANVWLGETSSAWGGGAVGLSDRYIAGFLWLDKLGMAARDGIYALIRQTFYGGHYSLIDSDTLNPNPDYWLTLLYKLLVSNKVLHVTSTDSKGSVRMYAHCTDTRRSGYGAGSVTVFILNLNPAPVIVKLMEFPSQTLHVYNLTPTDGDLLSQSVDLNGVTLSMVDDKTLPNLLQPIKTSGFVPISGLTFSFIVIPDAGVSICS